MICTTLWHWFILHVTFPCNSYIDEITGNDLKWTALLMAVYINLPHTVEKLLYYEAGLSI